MRRFHLFEWEDQPWLPNVFREFITDHLRYTQNEPMRVAIDVAIAGRLKAILQEIQSDRIVDLCSGAGGPLQRICRILSDELSFPVHVLLTDRYPNLGAFRRLEAETGGRIRGLDRPTRADAVPGHLTGLRTLFTAAHHFRPDQVRGVLADVVRNEAAIAIFEPLERTARMAFLVGTLSFVRGFTLTPRVGDLTLRRFLWTYVLPVAPALFAWDGMVSALRSYTPDELLLLARTVARDGYRWESGRFDVDGPYGPMPVVFLTGVPH